jgi:Ni/Fe-hydrogenase 1 B-type cytochrome subunit
MSTAVAAPNLVRVYVWEWPVRITHWLIAGSIILCSATGLYLGNPFLIVTGPAGGHFVMGWAKVIHFYGAIVFGLAVFSRIVWMFIGNTYARWDKFIPVPKKRRAGFMPTVYFYLFRFRKPPGFVGHNPVAGATYTLVFCLLLTMITTGVAIYSADAAVGSILHPFRFLIPLIGGLQIARWIHHIVMWLLLGFLVHHVYSALLMSQVEGNGTLESIFSGYKFVPPEDLVYSGYRFVDRNDVR